MPESEVSSTTFNYVISEDQLPITARTVDLKPAKSIAISNMSRITGVLRRAQEIDCRSSILYNSNRFQEDPESVRPGSPGSTKSSFVIANQPGPDGIIIGSQHNCLRPVCLIVGEMVTSWHLRVFLVDVYCQDEKSRSVYSFET